MKRGDYISDFPFETPDVALASSSSFYLHLPSRRLRRTWHNFQPHILCQTSIQETVVSLPRLTLHNPARLTIKTFVGRSLDFRNITPTHLLLEGFAFIIQNELSDKDLFMLSLVYWHFDALAEEPSRETRYRLVRSIENPYEFNAMCDIICRLYNDRVSKQLTGAAFMMELLGLLSTIESLSGNVDQSVLLGE
ncbi:uncharacterized protein BJX67DRAFT_334977 [Aspergillus lucknowensis]|uniref:Ligand-binding domain of nuclear hormone receptor n=1 Tax=Aspergillus lucknowensis TaxID=176173 RepID=A0ABR4L754_9EURO